VNRLSMIIFIVGGLCASIVRAEDLLAGADIGYGEYLSGECVTCHSQNGTNSGIPAINGLDAEVFATVMHAYKVGDVEHPVMQMVAGRLDGEQIASLAVYFASRRFSCDCRLDWKFQSSSHLWEKSTARGAVM
jgi:cytochrome c553